MQLCTPEHGTPVVTTEAVVDLRILATTDLHMELTGYDYVRGRPAAGGGLPALARLIAAERTGAVNCLLLDNGDLLQGNPLADHLASPAGRLRHGPHLAVAALGALGCDAATLGNHDFSYGTGFLRRSLQGAAYPVVCANVVAPGLRLPPWVVLRREVRDRCGAAQRLAVGVIGFLPPQTAAWEALSAPGLRTEDILAAARRELPLLRAAGAEVVVALAHSGIASGEENAAAALAALPGIDAVVAGHTHSAFPDPATPAVEGVDACAGTLWGRPAVQPGFGGSHLGVLDLVLQRHPAAEACPGWRVTAHRVRLVAASAAPPAPVPAPGLRRAHRAALDRYARRAGGSDTALTSFFALIGHDPGLRFVAQAQRWHLRRALDGARLPILAAVTPFRCGGRAGPQHYTDIPPGRLSRRSLADLYAFSNRLAVLEVTGADLREWLERAAGIFAQLQPGVADQALIASDFPAYNFDVIDGLDWTLDLSAAPLFDAEGARLRATGGRVSDLRHRGRLVAEGDRFLLATNSYRLSGVGLYGPLLGGRRPLREGPALVRDILHAYLRRVRRAAPPGALPFRFAPLPGSTALYDTGPGALAHLHRAPLPAEPLGLTAAGFLRLRLRLG